jgi:indole-3-glycerol phosphate synthase
MFVDLASHVRIEVPVILDDIIAHKKTELDAAKKERTLADLKKSASAACPRRDFKKALLGNGVSLIAEVKRASPSAGLIRDDFDPVQIARIYQQNGACAISVLTEAGYFLGKLEFLPKVRAAVTVPVLRKDFIFDEYQIYESKAYGADAILIIAAILADDKMSELIDLSHEIGLGALVEVHNEDELKRVLRTRAQIVGINNRNLKTMEVDLETTGNLAPAVNNEHKEARVVVSESGIKTFRDVQVVAKAGVNAILVGEALMRGGDIGQKVRELLGK